MKGAITVFVMLCVSYIAYTAQIWFADTQPIQTSGLHISEGKRIWQKYNCQACHQFYGLGGYMGPDLTNVYGKVKANRTVLAALIQTGNASMPAYKLEPDEMENLLDFLQAMNETGIADPKHFKSLPNGSIE